MVNKTRGIEKTHGVAGGQACIAKTHIPVYTLEAYRRAGWSDERILKNYPLLRPVDLVNAWAYVRDHTEEIESAMVQTKRHNPKSAS